MKPLLLYLTIACLSINIAGNLASQSSAGIKAAAQARTASLCPINKVYC